MKKLDDMIYWHTTNRTKGEFLVLLKKHIKIVEHSSLKETTYSYNKAIRFIQMIRYFKRKKINIIIIDGFTIELLAISLIAKINAIALVTRVRGGMNNEYIDMTINGSRIIHTIRHYLRNFIRNTILRLSDFIVPVSIFGKSQILYELPKIHSKKISEVVEPMSIHPVDSPPNIKKDLSLESNSNLITTVTSFQYFRKYDALSHYQESILTILKKNPNWYWVIVGSGRGLEKFKKQFNQTIDKNGLKGRIIFTGFSNDIETLLTATDIFFYPSFRDTASQAIKEAQFYGLPVVVNRSSCGPIEFIPKNSLSQKQIIERPEELEALFNELIASSETRHKLGQLNMKFALKHYSTEQSAHEFMKIFEQCSVETPVL